MKTNALSKLFPFNLPDVWDMALKFVLRLKGEEQGKGSAEENFFLLCS